METPRNFCGVERLGSAGNPRLRHGKQLRVT
jgi:hypothetical protein